MEHSNLLEQLWNGDLCPSGAPVKYPDQITAVYDQLEDLHAQLMDQLSSFGQQDLDLYEQLISTAVHEELNMAFAKGYKLATKLLIEGYILP